MSGIEDTVGVLNLSPKQAQELLEVSPSTLRRWSAVFATDLSRMAQPEHGRKRRYSQRDVARLQRVKVLFAQGLKTDEVKQELSVVALESTAIEAITLPGALAELDTLRELVEALAFELRESQTEREALRVEVERLAANDVEERTELRKLILWRRAWEGRPWWARILGLEPPQVDDE